MLHVNSLIGFGATTGDTAVGNDAYTVVLLHCDGTDASTTFTDDNSGGSSKTWTAVGDAQIDTAQSKFGGTSMLLDGSGDYVETPDHADFAFGTGDFTIDFWLRRSETGTAQHNLCGQGNSALSGGYHYFKLAPTTSTIQFAMNSDTYIASAGTITDTNWHHVMAARSGNNLAVALDGTWGSNVDITGITYTDSPGKFVIGRLGEFAASTQHAGWIDEFRVSKGVAREEPGSNFTPPTEAYG